MPLLQDDKKMTNQKILIKLMTEFVTTQIGDKASGKKYLSTLAEKDSQKALNKLGSTHADIKKSIEALPPGSELYNKREDEVVQAITEMLTAYNHSKKDEEVAIAIMSDAKTRMGTPQQQPAAPKPAATPAPAKK